MDLYFERHDGEAATIEDFVHCFADATGRDLTQFMLWYTQAGTPEVVVTARHDITQQDLSHRRRADHAADAGPARQGADDDPAWSSAFSAGTDATYRFAAPMGSRARTA